MVQFSAKGGLPSSQENLTRTDDTEVDRPDKKNIRGVRRRVAQACDRCRVRKDKCEAQKPVCSNCAENGRQCSYDMVAKKRGLPEGYVRGLEKLWGLAIRDVEDVEDSMLVVLENSIANTGTYGWDDRKISDNLVESWRNSQLSQELGRLLSDRGPMIETGKRIRIDPPDPGQSKRVRINQQSSEVQASKQDGIGNTIRKWMAVKPENSIPISSDSPTSGILGGNEASSATYDSILQPSYTQLSASNNTPRASTTLPDLPSETWHLLDVYFSYTHSWLPILVKHDILRISYQYAQSQHSVSHSGSAAGEYAALWAAIALAKFQHRAINNIPLAQGPVADMVWTAERMYTQARKLIPTEEGDLDSGHVQALLILAVANTGLGQFSRAWSLVGQAARLAIDLSLNKPAEQLRLASKGKSISKYIFLGCFVLDTFLAARLGRCPYLRSHEVDNIGYVDEDGVEEWDPWQDSLGVWKGASNTLRGPAALASTFNRLVQVVQVLNQAVCTHQDHSTDSSLNTILKQKLLTWNRNQPLQIHSTSYTQLVEPPAALLPHQYHLHAAYFATLATICLLSGVAQRDSRILKDSESLPQQIVDVFSEKARKFNPVIAPPTYEYFIKVAYDCASAINETHTAMEFAVDSFRHGARSCLETMEPAWPVFSIFKNNHFHESQQLARSESQVAYDLMMGSRDTPGSNRANRDHRNSVANVIRRPSNGRVAIRRTASSSNKAVDLSNNPEIPSEVSPQLWGYQEKPASVQIQSSNTTSAPKLSSTICTSKPNRMPIKTSQPLDPQLLQTEPHHSTSTNADPLFNEFATLDAVQWTDNWDNFLVNLGFNDPDNMNHDFITMSREPELPNDIFQHLAADSTDDSPGALAWSSLGGPGTGLDVFDFGDEHEGYEAGQILHSLSVAGEMELFKTLGG